MQTELTDQLVNSATGAPNDMTEEPLRRAINEVEFGPEFFHTVQTSRAAFGWYTRHYPRIFEYPWILFKLGNAQGKTIGDFGAGLSPLPLMLADRGAKVFTIDNHTVTRRKDLLFTANEWGFFNYAELNASITSLNRSMDQETFPRGSFDVWYSVSVVEHLPSAVRHDILNAMNHSLKDNGRLLLTFDLQKGSHKLWNLSEGNVVEDSAIHGSMTDIVDELLTLGFKINESRAIRLSTGERTDLGFIDACRI